jgi:hypothetical protein
MTMAPSMLLLSILRTEYETPAVGEWVTSRQAGVEDRAEADYTTSEGARSAVVACWKDGSGDLRAVPRILWCGRIASAARMGTAQSTPRSLNSAKGRSFGLSYAEMTASSTGWVW